jgi:FlaA1/EpsC-like NDP-sugar epimerase
MFPKLQRTASTRLLFFFAGDIFLITLSIVLAFLLRFEGAVPDFYLAGTLQIIIVLALLFLLPLLYFFHLYWLSWAYVSTEEMISLWKAVTIGFLLLAGTIIFFRDTVLFQSFPRSVLIVSYVFVFFSLGGLRIAKRLYLQFSLKHIKKEQRRTLIVGAGDAGEQLARSLVVARDRFLPVAFVDDNPIKKGVLIHGIKVAGRIDDIPDVVRNYQVNEIIIALPAAGPEPIKRAVEKGREAQITQMKVIPSLQEIAEKGVPIDTLREVQVEDLLGREPAELHEDLIREFLYGKKVLITGASGSIGSELCRQVARFEPEHIILFDQDETGIFQMASELKRLVPAVKLHLVVGNIQDKSRVEYAFSQFGCDVAFHAAAYKHVPLMEESPSEAIKNNIFGTQVVGEAASRHGIEKFVYVSTDKTVNPTSVMGATKRVGEMMCQALGKEGKTKFVSVRFGNVLDSRGSVIPTFRERLKRREALEVTHPEMERYFMITSEACLLIMEAGAMGEGGEVFVLNMGEPVKIVDLAREMIRLSGLEPDKDIPIVFIGPRPGEKLFEEVLSAEEGTSMTMHEQIRKATLASIDEALLQGQVRKLQDTVDTLKKEDCVAVLKNLVSTYTPQSWNNS